MARLFIIGNGFDLAHGLRTSYEDFRHYLIGQYPDAREGGYIIPEGSLMPDGGVGYNDNEVVSFLLDFISSAEPNGDRWSDLERTLGVLDYGWCFDDLPEMIDRDGDRNMWHEARNNEDRAEDIVIPMLSITDLFSDWIDTINVSKVKPRAGFKNIINRNKDHFLSFNYTETLETVYGAKRVSHIHGKQGETLVFGHGNNEDCYESYMSRHTGSESAIQRIHDRLRKNTKQAILDHKNFFDELAASTVNEVYSYGFSFSDVDTVYLREICRRVSTRNTVWHLHNHESPEQRKYFQSVIRGCGFRGSFSFYEA